MAGEEAPVSSGAAALEAAPAARVAFEDFIVPDGGLWSETRAAADAGVRRVRRLFFRDAG